MKENLEVTSILNKCEIEPSEALVIFCEDDPEGNKVIINRGSWRVKHKNIEKIFIATEEEPVIFRQIDD